MGADFTGATFVKASTTTTNVDASQQEIMKILRRYGAAGFGFRNRGADIVEVTFHIAREGSNEDLTVAIPINVATVQQRLNTPAAVAARKKQRKGPFPREHAERVAWRILVLWIDAALAAVSIGMQSIEEAFFANLVVETEDGQSGRMLDYIATLQRATGSARLPAAGALRALPGQR